MRVSCHHGKTSISAETDKGDEHMPNFVTASLFVSGPADDITAFKNRAVGYDRPSDEHVDTTDDDPHRLNSPKVLSFNQFIPTPGECYDRNHKYKMVELHGGCSWRWTKVARPALREVRLFPPQKYGRRINGAAATAPYNRNWRRIRHTG